MAEEEWRADSKGSASLSAEGLQDSIFELADLWTRGIQPEDYANFLRDVHERITFVGADGQRCEP